MCECVCLYLCVCGRVCACSCASGVGENRMLAGIGHAGAMALLISVRNCEFDFSRGEINIIKYSSLGLRVISAQSRASEA